MEGLMRQSIEPRLRKVQQPGSEDDEAVDLPKGVKAEHFCCVIGHSSVVKRTIQDEKGDIGEGSPKVGKDTKDTDGSSYCDKKCQDEGSAKVIEHEPNEWDGQYPPRWKSDIEDMIHEFSLRIIVQQVLILSPDSRNEVVDPCHLKHREDSNQNKPRRSDLFEG